ncbi:SLOW GREEN 1 protein [Spatholobus suberectus]|nr:SLOW GREEN 1 protein [Spatholobus suberectus]
MVNTSIMFPHSPPSISRAISVNCLPKLRHSNLSLNHPSPLSSSLSFSSSSFRLPSISASFMPSPSPSPRKTSSLPPPLQTLFSPVAGTTCSFIAATAFFFMRFHLHTPAVAAPPPAAEYDNEAESGAVFKIIDAVIEDRDLFAELEPEKFEWLLPWTNMHCHNDDHTAAAAARTAEGAVEVSEKQLKKDSRVRALRLLIAQIKCLQGKFFAALKTYRELVKEDPADFRPYYSQGLIYNFLRNKDETQKQFDKFGSLVPKDHPYKEYFEHMVLGAAVFAEIVGRSRERPGARG